MSEPSIQEPQPGPEVVDRASTAPSILSTLNDDGSRRWIKPRVSPGRFLTARRAVAYLLIALFTALPHLRIAGKPAILLDVQHREFTILGKTFLPTDTLLLVLLLLTIGVGIFFATAVLGRVWCGWACPQTVYMEFVYRPIERFFEGAPGRAKKNALQRSPIAKPLKVLTYLAISLVLAHTFLSYFVGWEQLRHWVFGSPWNHPAGFLIVLIVTALMMFDFTFFREQTCIVVCPYGRFQSVMLDQHSLIVSYDLVRGEPRGRKPAKGEDLSLPVVDRRGDCVDCKLCVQTCPTGIDIRNGLQMECVNCAQCIDACDAVMAKLGRPKGLIRYSSQSAITRHASRLLRPRVVVYPAILALLVSLFLVVLSSKNQADVVVIRGYGAPFTMVAPGLVGNQVRVKITNRRDVPATYTIVPEGVEGLRAEMEQGSPRLEPTATATVPAFVEAPASAFKGGTLRIRLRIQDDQGFVTRIPFTLQGPASRRALEQAEREAAERARPAPDHPPPGGTP